MFYFTLDPYLIKLSVKQGGIKCPFFLVFGMTRPRIEPRSPGALANTLLVRTMAINPQLGWGIREFITFLRVLA